MNDSISSRLSGDVGREDMKVIATFRSANDSIKIDGSKITHDTNYITERRKIIEELCKLDNAQKSKQSPTAAHLRAKPKIVVSRVNAGGSHKNFLLTGTSSVGKTTHRTTDEQAVREADQAVRPLAQRVRDFKLKVSSRKNMFEGFSYQQYDQYVITNTTMQKIILRDQLIIMIDKIATMKNEVHDDTLEKKIVRHIGSNQLRHLNRKVEEILAIMNELIKLLLFDILDDLDKIGLTKSPVEGFVEQSALNEFEIYSSNVKLLKGMVDYFKEGVECYMLLCKQNKNTRILPDINCEMVIQLIERGRFNVALVLESMKNIKEKIVFFEKEKFELEKTDHHRAGKKSANDLLTELFKKKYKQTMEIHKTRESKVDLKKETTMGLYNILTYIPKKNKPYVQKKREPPAAGNNEKNNI